MPGAMRTPLHICPSLAPLPPFCAPQMPPTQCKDVANIENESIEAGAGRLRGTSQVQQSTANARTKAADHARLQRLQQLAAKMGRDRRGPSVARSENEAGLCGKLSISSPARSPPGVRAPHDGVRASVEQRSPDGLATVPETQQQGQQPHHHLQPPQPQPPSPPQSPQQLSHQHRHQEHQGQHRGLQQGLQQGQQGQQQEEPAPSQVLAAEAVAPQGTFSTSTPAAHAAAAAAHQSAMQPPPLVTNWRAINQLLARERLRAARRNDLHNLNRLKTPTGIAAFVRQQRMRMYGAAQQRHNGLGGLGNGAGTGSSDVDVATEIATQTEELSEWSKNMLEHDEQSLENLAEADLAYLDMVRTKAGLHHQTAGARHARRPTAPCRACTPPP